MLVLLVLLCWTVARVGGAVSPLQSSCPELCRCDLAGTPRKVDCSGLDLMVFPHTLHASTQYLDLSNNSLTSLPPRLSSILPQLETLLLRHNTIDKLSSDAFRGLQDLRTVDLSYNTLVGTFPPRLLINNPRMLELRASHNHALEGATNLLSASLEILDMSACNITNITGSSFVGLSSLRILNMSLNPLEYLPNNLTIPSLRVLDLTQCQLLLIPSYVLTGTPKLQQLHIASNAKLDLPKNPSLISKSLLQLTADHCNIQHVSINNLPSLTHAYLSCNKITLLKRENFARNSALLEIDLGQNLLRELPVDVFYHAKNLVSVDLSSNHIESLQFDSFSCCKELKFLNLSRNDITKLPDLLTMPTLVIFDLSRCRLASLPKNPEFLNNMSQIRQLHLSHNELQTVPDLVSKTLRILDISYCHLTHITNHTFMNLVELQRLDLSGNRLTSLSANVFNDNNQLGTLKLDDNPWRCNCTDPEFQSLYKLAEQLSSTGRNQLKCNDPEELSGKLWEDACNIDTNRIDESNNWLLSLTLFLTLGALAGVILCTKRLVTAGQKTTRRTRRRERQQQRTVRSPRDSDSSDDELRVPRVRVQSATQCTPCSEGLRNQRRMAAEVQPPTYEEAVLMPTSSIVALSSPDTGSNNEIAVVETGCSVNNSVDNLNQTISERNSENETETSEVQGENNVNNEQQTDL